MNGVTIQDDQRKGAEYDYIKKYALEWIRVQHTEARDTFLNEHNRFLELIQSISSYYIYIFIGYVMWFF